MQIWDIQLLEGFILAFLRVGTAIALLPVFGYPAVPVQIKAGLAFILAVVTSPVAGGNMENIPPGVMAALIAAGSEVLVGFIFGLVTSLILVGAEFAGTVVGLQMGFAIVNVVDPQSGGQVALIGRLEYLFALTVFITLDMHLHYISLISYSFDLIPLGGILYSNAVSIEYARITSEVFVIAIKLAAPVMAALYLTEISLGIIARTVPQMNVFIVGFPLKIGVGLLGLAITMHVFVYILNKVFIWFETELRTVLVLISGV